MKVLLDDIAKIEEFVSIVSRSECDIDLISGKSIYLDAKSILGIMSCNIKAPLDIEIVGDDADKETLVNNIKKFIVE